MKIQVARIDLQQMQHTHKLEPTDRFCGECGEAVMEEVVLTEWVCSECRFFIPNTAVYCTRCGKVLETQDVAIEYYHHMDNKITKADFDKKKLNIRK